MNKERNSAIIVPIKGLSVGVDTFAFSREFSFFDQFGNQEIRDAQIEISITLQKENHLLRMYVSIQGSVVRSCDRCLGDVRAPISYQAPVVVQFSEKMDEEESEDIITVSPTAIQIDLSQYIYDSVCVSLPLQSLHPAGECDPEMQLKLSRLTVNL